MRNHQHKSEFMFFTELVDAALKTATSPFHDKFCKGLSTAMIAFRRWEDPLPIWLAFALQTYVDVHHILKNNIGRGLEHMRMTAIRYITSSPGHIVHTWNCSVRPLNTGMQTEKTKTSMISRYALYAGFGKTSSASIGLGSSDIEELFDSE